MTVTLTPELECAVAEEAQKRGTTAAEVVLDTLQKKFLPEVPFGHTEDMLDEWELEISAAAAQVGLAPADHPEERC